MPKNGNKMENWNESYEHFKTTYSETIDTPENLVNKIQFEFVLEDIERFLPSSRQSKILECGCGGARTALYLAKRGFDVTCSDYALGAIRLAKDNFAACCAYGKFLQDDLLNSKIPAESFDCVMSFGLLEHFTDLQPILASTTRLVKTGGIQIHCIIPKKFSSQTLLNIVRYPFKFTKNLITGKFNGIFRLSFRNFPHYENSFSAYEYCQAFKREGNSILRCEAGGFLYPFLTIPRIGYWLVNTFPGKFYNLIRITDRTESKIWHLIAPTFYIICRKQGSIRNEYY